MKAKPSYSRGTFSVEIWLANDRSLFVSPQTARKLAYDILEILQKHEDSYALRTSEGQGEPAFEIKLRAVPPPSYLEHKAVDPISDGPADLLLDGRWRGHSTSEYTVFSVQLENERVFKVRLPQLDDEGGTPPVVVVTSKNKISFPVYDARKHPGSGFEDSEYQVMNPRMQSLFRCPQCSKQYFQVSVGFELAGDYQEPDDTVWFALAVKCVNCNWASMIYEDETV